MSSNELYYLIMVCAAFIVFGVMIGGSYIQYRNWLKHQPHQADD